MLLGSTHVKAVRRKCLGILGNFQENLSTSCESKEQISVISLTKHPRQPYQWLLKVVIILGLVRLGNVGLSTVRLSRFYKSNTTIKFPSY